MKQLEEYNVLDKTYLRTQISEDEKGFAFNMFCENVIEGFLIIGVRNENEKENVMFDITSLSKLEEIYSGRIMNLEELSELFLFVCRQREKLRNYMLPLEGLVLSEKYIYKRVDCDEMLLLYFPFSQRVCQDTLLDYLLSIIDHEDDDMTKAVYEIYSQRDNPMWPELLKKKLVYILEGRKNPIKNAKPIYIEETQKKQGIERENNIKKRGVVKACILSVLSYTILAILCMGYILSRYVLSPLEMGVSSALIVSGMVCIICIIIHKYDSSLTKEEILKYNFKSAKEENKGKAEFITDKRWFDTGGMFDKVHEERTDVFAGEYK